MKRFVVRCTEAAESDWLRGADDRFPCEPIIPFGNSSNVALLEVKADH